VQMTPEVEGIWGCELLSCLESQCPVENTSSREYFCTLNIDRDGA